MQAQRLDKWLWCARLARTRCGAQRAIEAGKVRINGARAIKASRSVQAGDVVTATLLGKLYVVRVLASAERRGPASAASKLYYDDLTPPAGSRAERTLPDQAGPAPARRAARFRFLIDGLSEEIMPRRRSACALHLTRARCGPRGAIPWPSAR